MLNWMRRFFARDDLIDSLIARNHYKPCDGMLRVDMQKLNRLGERTWHEKLRGQRRYRGEPGKVVRFK